MKGQPSFTQTIKEELCSSNNKIENYDKSLLAAFIRINGSLVFRDRSTYLVLNTENAKIARLIYQKIKDYFNPSINLSFSNSFKKKMNYTITIGEGNDQITDELEISFLESKISKNLVKNDEMISGYLAGAFLACGSVNSPKTSNYHLELALNNENYAKWMLHLFNRYSACLIEPKMIQRREKTVIYIKKSQQIADFLALIGAVNSLMEFENVRIERDFKNNENRLENIDVANMNKIYKTALKQIDEIKYIDKVLGLKNITSSKQRILCQLRLENETASLQDLADLMSEQLDKPVTKSNINHLFRSIHETYLRLSKWMY